MSSRLTPTLPSSPSESGKYVKSLVFGGLDGIITTFAVVAASVGGSLSTDVILLMGFANLVADGLSMGFGDYLSSQAEFEYTRAEHKREKWELDNYPEGEKQEMVELYVKNGKFELSVPKSQMYTNWSVHVDALPTPVGSGNLPPPSSDDWQIKATLYAIESLAGAGGKIPGHVLFRRGLALSQLLPADKKGLENFDRKVVGAVATFRKRNCYQRLNQMDSDAKTDLWTRSSSAQSA